MTNARAYAFQVFEAFYIGSQFAVCPVKLFVMSYIVTVRGDEYDMDWIFHLN